MSVEIEGLEFQVEAKSDKGTDGIDKLANSFKNLKSAIKGGTNLNGSIKQLEKLNQALSGLHTDKLESLGKAMESLNKAGNIHPGAGGGGLQAVRPHQRRAQRHQGVRPAGGRRPRGRRGLHRLRHPGRGGGGHPGRHPAGGGRGIEAAACL